MMEFIPWVALALGVIGMVLNALKKMQGFIVWMGSNFLFIYSAASVNNWAQVIFFIFCTFACVFGIYNWRKKNEKSNISI